MIELAATLETQHTQHHIHCIFFLLLQLLSSWKPPSKQRQKHFKLGWPSIVATWRDANGFIVEVLKGSKDAESRRAWGWWRPMTPVHWWSEVTKRREEEGLRSVLYFFIAEGKVSAVNCYGFSSIRVLTQTEINRDCCQDTLREGVE